MFGLLLGILILDGILLMVVVLLQAGKGGGLAAMGGGAAGTDTFMGGRQAASFLTRATWVAGSVFLVLAVVLAVLSSRRQEPAPLLQGEFQQGEAAQPQPVLPGLEEEPAGEATEPPPVEEPLTRP